MLYRTLDWLDSFLKFDRAKAHCDIPCGIYDPHNAQIAALTVVRMDDMIRELESEKSGNLQYSHQLARLTKVKEDHAETCKHEIRVIWGDYIKPEHLEQYSELNDLVHRIMKLGSQGRQTPDREKAMELLNSVNRFAEIFWQTKNIKTKRVKVPYEPKEEIVIPAL